MKIKDIRLGFANNSSSTHSILVGATKGNESPSGDGYGWEWFHLKNPDEKMDYFASQMFGSLPENLSDHVKVMIIKEFCGIDVSDRIKTYSGYGSYFEGVDHQSQWQMHEDFYGKIFPKDFYEDFKKFILREDVSIRGGNDNDEGKEFGEKFIFDFDNYGCYPIVKSKQNGYYTLFNRYNGAKVKITFDLDENGNPIQELECSQTPDLVDISITDYCPYNCSFCYRDSTKKGKHADFKHIDRLARKMGEMEVLEVAIGGGEPTRHPEFVEILRCFQDQKVTPNFTSFNMDWTKFPEIKDGVIKYAGSFAISNMSKDTVDEIARWNEGKPLFYSRKKGNPSGTLQIPLGCHSKDKIVEIINYIKENHGFWKVPITFLGFKNFGRGIDFDKEEYSWIIDLIKDKELNLYRFGADTIFVKQFQKELDDMEVSESLRVGEEGVFSMFIDATNKLKAPSSFTNKVYDYENEEDAFSDFPYIKDKKIDNLINILKS